jgi:RNA polymerase sigma-70 factor (sigma-E family)
MTDDRESFTRWAEQRQLRLLRTAVLLTGDHQRAEDLVQEALTKVALRWRRLRDGNPDAYARTVLVRDNVSWWRRHRNEVVREVDDRRASPSHEAPSERRLVLADALARLAPRQRACVVLRYLEDLPEREVAEALGVSVGTVKSQTHLALRRLREAAPELALLLEEDAR